MAEGQGLAAAVIGKPQGDVRAEVLEELVKVGTIQGRRPERYIQISLHGSYFEEQQVRTAIA